MHYKIVVPVYNEEKYVKNLLDGFEKEQLENLILVDDGSIDKTNHIVKQHYPNVTILRHRINLGKGKSMETGAIKAIQNRADVIVFMDGDLQHKPKDVERFLEVLEKNPDVDIVFGARTIGKNMHIIPFVGNKTLTIIINLLFGYFLNDTQCGFRAIRSKIFDKIRWQSEGYQVETEMIVNAAKHRLKYKEIPIDTIYFDNYKGTSIFDGIVILFKIMALKLFK